MATKTKKRSVAPKAGDTVILKAVPKSLQFLKGLSAKINEKTKTDYSIRVSNGGMLVFSQSELRKGVFKVKVLQPEKTHTLTPVLAG